MLSPKPCPDNAAVTESISRIPGPPTGPSPRITTTSPALIVALLDRLETRLLAVENRAGPVMSRRLQSRDLGHRAVRRQIAVQDHEMAGAVQRPVQRSHHVLLALENALHVFEILGQRRRP